MNRVRYSFEEMSTERNHDQNREQLTRFSWIDNKLKRKKKKYFTKEYIFNKMSYFIFHSFK